MHLEEKMGLGNLTNLAVSVVLAAALLGNLDRLQLWVIKAQAKLLYESRASSWGNPSVFKSAAKNQSPRQNN